MKVVIIGSVWPERTSSAAGLREWNLIGAFQEMNWEIYYLSPCKLNSFVEDLEKAHIKTFGVQLNDSAFDSLIQEIRPEIVVFDRFIIEEQFGWRVAQCLPEALRVLDTQDLHFLRRARESAIRSHVPLDVNTIRSEDVFRELASIYRSDLTFVLSDFEYDLLIEKYGIPQDLLLLLRFSYVPQNHSSSFNFETRKNLCMIGNFRHPPNLDATFYLHEKIWPLLQKQAPGVEVHLFGAYPPQEVMRLDDPQRGFRVKGWVQNHLETIQTYRLLIAPLRYGAGIKGKISDAWYTGTPVVTTSIGAEGMAGDLPWGGRVSDSPEEFIDHCIQLHENSSLWMEAQNQGLKIIQELYSVELFNKTLIQKILQLQFNLVKHRKNNLMGSILRHHLYQSTKYFSKWIEAKNLKNQSPPT